MLKSAARHQIHWYIHVVYDRGLSQLHHEKLHWFDVRNRVTFKLVVMVHRRLNDWAARYLAVHCVPLSSQRYLRSAERNLLHVPRHRLNTYGRPAFAIGGLSAWNSLPDPVCNPDSTKAAFRCLLNTFYCSHGTSAPSVLGDLLAIRYIH